MLDICTNIWSIGMFNIAFLQGAELKGAWALPQNCEALSLTFLNPWFNLLIISN